MRRFVHNAGFTVVELMIVVAMIGILSTLVFFNLSGTEASDELDSAQAVVEADLRRIITYAQTGRVDDTSGIVPLGYGIHYDAPTTQYILFTDYGDLFYDAGFDTIIETIDLETGEQIDGVTVASCLPGVTACDLVVTTPNGEIFVGGAPSNDLTLILEHVGSGETRSVILNSQTGQISH